ncbi:MAG: transporter substrate-binding domain-containing protein, partial [Rhizobiales bacterium]|nr:transporter substrate-binding domain-containing protein [Hyphomicrobiales bacterium]
MAVAQPRRPVALAPQAFFAAALFGAVVGVLPAAQWAQGQDGVTPPSVAGVPGFWDPRRRPERPDLSRLQSIRFLTELDYPPFNYAGTDDNPAGFNVDLARQLCDEIKVTCTIQARRIELLLDPLDDNPGDAVIASI